MSKPAPTARIAIALVAFISVATPLAPAAATNADANHAWQARQGDIVRVSLRLPASLPPGTSVRLRALGHDWPAHRMAPGHWDGWIGVDLSAKPGEYPVRWRIGTRIQTQKLRITPGHFRVSRITVPRNMAVFDKQTLARIRADHAALRQAERQHVTASPAFVFRMPPARGVVSTPFGARRYVNGKPRSPHSGLDIAAPEGEPVLAPMAGRVLMARDMYLSGNTVLIGHGEGLVSIYAHLRALNVRQGQWLKTGEKIGEVGATGRATGPHLHWGVRFRGARVNPASLLSPASHTARLSRR